MPPAPIKIIIVGAGLAGLGAAISLRQAGHAVTVLEAAQQIAEVGAGIQCLPNSTRVLSAWGVLQGLNPAVSRVNRCNIRRWSTGDLITSTDFGRAGEEEYGSPFCDFHRADLVASLLARARGLGAVVVLGAEVEGVRFGDRGAVVLVKGWEDGVEADLVVGADGIHSVCRGIVTGVSEPPRRTGDMAYRLLLRAEDIVGDPELRPILEGGHTNFWYGPGAHIVTYALRERSLLNMVLLVPDNMPEHGPSTLQGYVDEMQALFKDWDPRIGNLLSLCTSVLRWRLCVRDPMASWVHQPSGRLVLLGDAAHATLPYLASGAGMAFEDGAVLGECLARIRGDASSLGESLRRALAVYERCRKTRTETVVWRGGVQQVLNHLDDGEEQRERDRRMRVFGEVEEAWWRGERGRGGLPEGLGDGDDPLVWRRFGVGEWLLGYDCKKHVDEMWS